MNYDFCVVSEAYCRDETCKKEVNANVCSG